MKRGRFLGVARWRGAGVGGADSGRVLVVLIRVGRGALVVAAVYCCGGSADSGRVLIRVEG